MRNGNARWPRQLLTGLAALLVIKVTLSVVSGYVNYFPPNFSRSEFLRGRESYFFGWYRWAFYAHILSGPIHLLLGLILVGRWSSARFPNAHRVLGRIQAVGILLLLTPSGLLMAAHAAAGPVAAVALATLALATALCTVMGVQTARQRRYAAHRRWMIRCFLLLASAVVLRLFGGLATVAGIAAPWYDPLANWLAWLLPLAVFEIRERTPGRPQVNRPPRPIRTLY